MDEKILIGIVSALIGVAGTYLVAILKHRKDLEFRYDTDLRDKRITQYLELWKLLQVLALNARAKEISFEDLKDVAGALRQWYFEKGGLFLSEKSWDAYFALQESIKKVLNSNTQAPRSPLGEATYEALQRKASDLRTTLTQDVGMRKRPRLNWLPDASGEDWDEFDEARPRHYERRNCR